MAVPYNPPSNRSGQPAGQIPPRMRLVAATTNATPARVTADGLTASAANVPVVPATSVVRAEVIVTAIQTAGSAGAVGDSATWRMDLQFRRGPSGNVSYVGGFIFSSAPGIAALAASTDTAPDRSTGTGSAWRVAVSADTTLQAMNITVTGAANTTIAWAASVLMMEPV